MVLSDIFYNRKVSLLKKHGYEMNDRGMWVSSNGVHIIGDDIVREYGYSAIKKAIGVK